MMSSNFMGMCHRTRRNQMLLAVASFSTFRIYYKADCLPTAAAVCYVIATEASMSVTRN